MPDDKNPQDITPTFIRKYPDGKTEKLDGNGKPVSKPASTQQAASDTSNLKTGELPKNTIGYGKLGAMQPPVTTYEALREATDEQLRAAELTDEQITTLRQVQAQPVKA